MSALEEIEWRLIEMLMDRARGAGARVLHAGCVVHEGRPIVFVARSGRGKSTMSRAAVQRGAHYVTDDLLVLKGRQMAGLSRSIRFTDVPMDGTLPDWLEGAQFLPRHRLEARRVPVFGDVGSVQTEVELGAFEVIVVALERGGDVLRELSSRDRLVHLHEAAIASAGDYDGTLGQGPTCALAWTNPERAFTELEHRYFAGQVSS